MHKPQVTICIPAYNEQPNIRNLLVAILAQSRDTFELTQIIIDSDGSTDGTAEAALSVESPLIVVKQHPIRRGKVALIREQLGAASGDILVQFDADIHFPDAGVIERLIRPFLESEQPDMVCGMHWPLPPRTFIERLAYFGADCWESAKAALGENGDMYNSLGQIRAFTAEYARQIELPDNIGTFEDTFLYLYTKKLGKTVTIARDAVVNFRLASTYGDYVKQMSRFVVVKDFAKRYFTRSLLRQYEHMTIGLRFKVFLRKIFKYPLYISLGYIALQTRVKLSARTKVYGKAMWDTAESSKIVE